jgi:hypothetical protein
MTTFRKTCVQRNIQYYHVSLKYTMLKMCINSCKYKHMDITASMMLIHSLFSTQHFITRDKKIHGAEN